ncbi:hypothetical protein MTR67_002585 [Solanum verrucosum]|uniref:Uncharacterized protein n=1 Tax=Solanum verrucosum TaxID=315347 RepID=A0AAF0PSQ1_SOLVR|nr:hypothetical protein MTR67_002585 [Solanum verrucosum]
MALVLPNVPVYQALKEKIKSVIESSSPRVAERFRGTVLYCPKLQDLKDAEGKCKKVIQMTNGRISEWIGDPDLFHQLVLRITLFGNYKYLFKFLA